MLTRTGFSNNAGFAHAHGQKDLTNTVIDLVRAGVVELVTLEIDLGPAKFCCHAFGEIKRAWTANVIFQVIIEFFLELRVILGVLIGLLKLKNQWHERFGDKTATVITKMPVRIRKGAVAVGLGR